MKSANFVSEKTQFMLNDEEVETLILAVLDGILFWTKDENTYDVQKYVDLHNKLNKL